MKIVDVSESYSERGGGVRSYVHRKMRVAAALGHEMVLLGAGTEHREERRKGGRIVWIPTRRSPVDPSGYGLFADPAAVHAVLDKERPDVVEGSSPWGGGRYVASWPGSALKSFVFHTDPMAVWPETFLGPWLGFRNTERLFGFIWRRMRTLAAGFDLTVVAGPALQHRLQQRGLPRVVCVPFGIDKKRFSPALRDPDLRRRLLESCGAGGEERLLVAVCRFDPEKHVGTLLGAFRRLRRRRPVSLLLYGRGALERWVRFRSRRLAGVHVAGFEPDREAIAAVLASADLFLHGSAAETYGLVVGEALCSGLPVVVPDRGAARELIVGDAGGVYRTADATDCAAVAGRLLDADPAGLRAACSRAAASIIDIDEHFRRLFRLYESLADLAPAERQRLLAGPLAEALSLSGEERLVGSP